jgi:hypothetical protein
MTCLGNRRCGQLTEELRRPRRGRQLGPVSVRPDPQLTVVVSRAVYVVVYALTVRRTNIYLSAVEQAALDAKAAAEGSTRSEVLRALVDRELNLDDEGSDEVDAALVALASELAERSRQLSVTDADLSSTA